MVSLKEKTKKKTCSFILQLLQRLVLGSLNEGDELTFEVENGEKGPSAVKLQKA